MGKVYVGKGTAQRGLIRLDDDTGLPEGRVSVIVEAESETKRGSVFDIPPAPDGGRPAEELLAELRTLRDEWDRPWGEDDRDDKE